MTFLKVTYLYVLRLFIIRLKETTFAPLELSYRGEKDYINKSLTKNQQGSSPKNYLSTGQSLSLVSFIVSEISLKMDEARALYYYELLDNAY